jgi:hypothetical protein
MIYHVCTLVPNFRGTESRDQVLWNDLPIEDVFSGGIILLRDVYYHLTQFLGETVWFKSENTLSAIYFPFIRSGSERNWSRWSWIFVYSRECARRDASRRASWLLITKPLVPSYPLRHSHPSKAQAASEAKTSIASCARGGGGWSRWGGWVVSITTWLRISVSHACAKWPFCASNDLWFYILYSCSTTLF